MNMLIDLVQNVKYNYTSQQIIPVVNIVHSVFLLKIGKTFNEAQNNCLLQMVEYKVPNAEISQQKSLSVYS